MYKHTISRMALDHLGSIHSYGTDTWGESAANKYIDKLLDQFDRITDNPYAYQVAPDLVDGYRRCVCGSHAIYYRIDDENIIITAILGKQNLNNFFD